MIDSYSAQPGVVHIFLAAFTARVLSVAIGTDLTALHMQDNLQGSPELCNWEAWWCDGGGLVHWFLPSWKWFEQTILIMVLLSMRIWLLLTNENQLVNEIIINHYCWSPFGSATRNESRITTAKPQDKATWWVHKPHISRSILQSPFLFLCNFSFRPWRNSCLSIFDQSLFAFSKLQPAIFSCPFPLVCDMSRVYKTSTFIFHTHVFCT